MRRLSLIIVACAVPFIALAQGSAISREDGFLIMWNSIHRPVEKTSEKMYADLSKSDSAYDVIRYAKSRNILGDAEKFQPKTSLALDVALTWLFRTRNIDDPKKITPKTLPDYLARYPIALLPKDDAIMPTITEDQLYFLMRSLDEDLQQEVHEVSLYSEQFNGQGTAFGEIFNMYALTAAHRTYPGNTLVKVTNVENQKTVTVRINDRGPYVKGRDMDLSLGAFTTIANRSEGVIHATFQRLGDANLVGPCFAAPTFAQRITKDTILMPGVPHVLHMSGALVLRATKPFVVRSIMYPDGNVSSIQKWVIPRNTYSFKPSIAGDYTFRLSSLNGHNRTMTMTVVQCEQ